MNRRRYVSMVGAAALVVPLTGGTAMSGAASAAAGTKPAAVPASVCFPSTDNGDPVLKTFSVEPKDVDARTGARTVTFTATAEDTGGPGAASGLSGGTVYVSFEETPETWNLRAPLTVDASGKLTGSLTIEPWYRTATRYLSVSVDDKDGNATVYSTADLERLGLPSTFTTTTSAPDARNPLVRSVQLSSTSIDTRRHSAVLTVRVRATDDSGLDGIRTWLWGAPVRHSGGRMSMVSGTPKDGVWEAKLRVPRWQGNHKAKLAIELTDLAQRFNMYGPKKLAAIGQPGTVRIVSGTDSQPPTLKVLSVSPATVDLRSGARSVTVTVRLKDGLSGVRRAAMSLDGPSRRDGESSAGTRLSRVTGTGRNGIWKGTVTLQPCETVAGAWRLAVFAWDAAQGDYVAIRKALTVVNGDIQRPIADPVGDSYQVRRSGPVTVRFTEDVIGITAENALVHVGDGQRGRGGDDPARIDGSWACKDASDAAVDCATGPVRSAAFTPAAPLLAGTNHTIQFNPEHHLGLTDLAGNPYNPTWSIGFHTS